MNSPTFDRLSALVAPLQDAWASLFDTRLQLSREETSENGARMPILLKRAPLAWLNANVTPEKAPSATALLQIWTNLLSQFLEESQMANSLAEELIIAWNRQAFLNSVISLMRTTTDVSERSLRSLQLATQVLPVESAFLAQNTQEGLRVNWVGPDIWGNDIRKAIAALRDHGGQMLSNDPDGCYRSLNGLSGARSFLGQQCDTHDSAGIFVGMINHVRGQFNAGDIQMFDSLIEMIKTFAETHVLVRQQQEAEKLDHDLSIAAEIQTNFFPNDLPPLPHLDLALAMIPATRLSGDFYDVVACGPDRLMIVVADVAGKGIPAALLAAELRAVFRTIIRDVQTPDQIMQRVNTELFGDMERNERFATVMLVSVPSSGGELSYASAGHATALHLKAVSATVNPLASTSLPLGIIPTLEPGNRSIDFAPQDVLVVYSDGLTEAEDPDGKLFSLRRVEQTLVALRCAPAHLILKGLVDSARQHRQSALQTDDLTLVVLKQTSLNEASPLYQDHLHFAGNLATLPRIGQRLAMIQEYLPRDQTTETWLLEVELAITEAVSNIIRHSFQDVNGEIDGLVTLYPDRLEIDLVDGGASYELGTAPPVDLSIDDLREGGYGLGIIRKVMDKVDYQRLPDDFNLLKMSRAIPSSNEQAVG